jgi:hypothetical protein
MEFDIVALGVAGVGVIPSRAPLVNFKTILHVTQNNKENTRACVAATTILDPLGGKLTKIPGVRIKKSTKT